jgi:hypothetical protein
MPIDATQLIKKYDRLKRDHELWSVLWQEIAEVIHPRRSQFMVQRTQGAKQTERLFDSTALDAHDRLASTLNGTLTSRAAKWFSLKMRDEIWVEDQDVNEWLEDCGKRMFRAFNQSNFAQEVHEVYLDECAFGTSALFLEERKPEKTDFHGFIFRCIPLNTFVLDEDQEGRVNTVIRKFSMSAAAAVALWGEKNLGEKVLKAIADGKSETMFEFLHAVYPRLTGTKPDPKLGTPNTELPWASAYVGIADKNPITESGFNEFPFMVPRWSKSSGEKYGRGPGHLALPDVKTLNKVVELSLKMWAKNLDMPTKSISDSVVGPIRNTPGGNTIVSNMDYLQPLFPPGSFREAIGNDKLKSDDLKAAIRRYFYADQMELPVGPAMTAFEVAKRFELLQRLLGPTMGRQESELLNPLIERAFGIMYRHGALPKAPAVLTQGGADIDVAYEGPLAKSQRLSEVEGLERLQQYVAGAAQLDPTIIDNIDFDEALRISADVLGVPSKILRSQADVQKLREQKQAAQQQQQQIADAGNIATAAGKAAPALKLLPDQAGKWGGIPPGGSSGSQAA